MKYSVQVGHVAHNQGTDERQDGGERMWLWNQTQLVPTTYSAL